MDNQQGPIVQHREFCSMLCGSLDERRVWGRVDTCICMAESLCCTPETIPTLLIHYTMIQNKKLKKKTTKKESLWKNSDNKNKWSLTIRISIIILSSLLNWEISTFMSNNNSQEIPHTEEHIKLCHEKFNQQNDLVPSINKLPKKKWQMRTLKMQI